MPNIEEARWPRPAPGRSGEVDRVVHDDEFEGGGSAPATRSRGDRSARAARPARARRAGRPRAVARVHDAGGSALGHCVDELKRVQWPDRRQVGQGTAVTLGFTVLAGGYLGLLDAIWKPLIEAIL